MSNKFPDSQARCVMSTIRPDISLYKALSSCFTFDRMTYMVSNCPDAIFKRFIAFCSQAALESKYWKPFDEQELLLLA